MERVAPVDRLVTEEGQPAGVELLADRSGVDPIRGRFE